MGLGVRDKGVGGDLPAASGTGLAPSAAPSNAPTDENRASDAYIGPEQALQPPLAAAPTHAYNPLLAGHPPSHLNGLRASRLAAGWLPLSDVVAFFETAKREGLADIRGQYGEFARRGIDPAMVDDVLVRRFDVKPAQLEHEIGHQNSNPNRSITELVSNSVDASRAGAAPVEVMIEDGRYVVEDFGKGMSAPDVFEKLLIPNLSGKDGEKTIGRFGIGFFTALAHLHDENSRVVVDTKVNGEAGVRLEFLRLNGELGVRVGPSDRKESGTRIEVRDAQIRRDVMAAEMGENLSYVLSHPINANGERINNLDPARIHSVGNGRLYISAESGREGKVVLTVGGVRIESFSVKGSSVPRTMVFDLPLSTKLPESRNRIRVDAGVVEQVKAFIAFAEQIADPEERLGYLNGMAPLIRELQGRNELITKDSNLIDHARAAWARYTGGRKFVPTDKPYDAIADKDALHVDDLYLGSNWAERFPKPAEWSGAARMAIVDMPDDAPSAIVHDKERRVVLLDRRMYEAHKADPALLTALASLPPGEINGTWNWQLGAGAVTAPKAAQAVGSAAMPHLPGRDPRIDALISRHPALMGQRSDLYGVLANVPDAIDLLSQVDDVIMPYRGLERLMQRGWNIATSSLDDTDSKPFLMAKGKMWRATAADGTTLIGGEVKSGVTGLKSHGNGDERIYVINDGFSGLATDARGRVISKGDEIFVSGDGDDRGIIVTDSDGLSKLLDAKGQTILQGMFTVVTSVGQDKDRVIFVRREAEGDSRSAQGWIRCLPEVPGGVSFLVNRGIWEAHFADGRVEQYKDMCWNGDLSQKFFKARDLSGNLHLFDKDGEILADREERMMKLEMDKEGNVIGQVYGSGADRVVVAKSYNDKQLHQRAVAADGRVIFEGKDIKIHGEGIDRVYIVRGNDDLCRIFGADGKPLIKGAFKDCRVSETAEPYIQESDGRIGFGRVIRAISDYVDDDWSQHSLSAIASGRVNPTRAIDHYFRIDGMPIRIVDNKDSLQYGIYHNERTLIYSGQQGASGQKTPRRVLDVRSLASEGARRNLRALVDAKMAPGFQSVALQALSYSPDAFDLALRLVPHITTDLNGSSALMERLSGLASSLSPETLAMLFDIGVSLGIGPSCTAGQVGKLAVVAELLGSDGLKRFRDDLLKQDDLWRVVRNHEWDKVLALEPKARASVYYLLMDDAELLAPGASKIQRIDHETEFSLVRLDAAVQSHRSEWRSFVGEAAHASLLIGAQTAHADIAQSKARLSHAMYHLGDARQHLYLRELLQNSLDAIRRERGGNASVSVESFEEAGHHVLRITDPAGMDLSKVLNHLLIYGESTKGETDLGKFGIGFFTIYPGAEEIRIRTGKGDGRTVIVSLRPVYEGDVVVDIKASYAQSDEPFKGTVIERISREANASFDAAMVRASLQMYGRFVDPKEIQITYNGAPVNKGLVPLAERDVPGLGPVRVYEARENAYTVGSLYVKDLPLDMINALPAPLREICNKHGMVIDLPTRTTLVRSRNEFVDPSAVERRVRGALSAMLLEVYLKRFATGEMGLDGLPSVYFDSNYNFDSLSIPAEIQADARRLKTGEPIADIERYQDERAFTQLVTLLPCIEIKGERISLYDLVRRLERGEEIDTKGLPMSVASLINKRQADEKKKKDAVTQLARLADEVSVDATMPKYAGVSSLARTWSRQEAFRPQAAAYDAFLEIADRLLTMLGFQNARVRYSSRPEDISTGAFTNSINRTPNITFGLFCSEKYVEALSAILGSEQFPLEEFSVLMTWMIEIVTHEMTHHQLERPAEWTHDAEFYRRQQTLITRLMRRGSLESDKLWVDLKAKYANADFVDMNEYLKLLAGKEASAGVGGVKRSPPETPDTFVSDAQEIPRDSLPNQAAFDAEPATMGSFTTYDPTAGGFGLLSTPYDLEFVADLPMSASMLFTPMMAWV
ncbi:MAG: ATP-binding protein [bacterium]